MRSKLLTCVGGLAGLCLTALPAPAQQPFAKSVGDVKVAPVQKGDVLEVPFILWGGDVATFLANGGLETKEGTLFAKHGLKLKLVPGDDFPKQVKSYLEGKSPFLRGTVSMFGLAAEVLNQDPSTRPVVFLQLTWSAGDHLIARAGCKRLDDLKGKKIALQKEGPHVGMLDDILRTAKLTWKDVTVVWTDDVTGDKGPAALFRKDAGIDACFAITPDMEGLTGGLDATGTGDKDTVKAAHVLVSTAFMSRSIADVYACRKDFYDAHRDVVEKFAAGYLKGCEELVALKKAEDKEGMARFKDVLQMTQTIYGKDAIKTEADARGLIDDAAFVGLPGNVSFFTNKGNLSGFAPKAAAAVELAVGQGYAAKKTELLKADLAYDKLKDLGKLTGKEPEQDRFRENVKILAENSLYYFKVGFEPNQSVFPEEKYGNDFQRALEQASLFGNAVIAVRGHTDAVGLLNNFKKVGLAKGVLTEKDGKLYLKKDNSLVDLKDVNRVVALIKSEDFGTDELKKGVDYLNDLSNKRSEAVRNAVIKFATDKGIRLDKSQIRAVGLGPTEPVVAIPVEKDDFTKNRRVEFSITKVSPEGIKPSDFDY